MHQKPFYFTDFSHCALCNWCRCRPFFNWCSCTEQSISLLQLNVRQISIGAVAHTQLLINPMLKRPSGQRRLRGPTAADVGLMAFAHSECRCTFWSVQLHVWIVSMVQLHFRSVIGASVHYIYWYFSSKKKRTAQGDYWQISKVAFFLVSCFPCWTKPYNCCSTKSRQTW